MANDRLYIKCDICGELLFIGKHFLGPWNVYNKTLTDANLAERLERFLEKHWLECDMNRTEFSFITEMSNDFPDKPKYFSMVNEKEA